MPVAEKLKTLKLGTDTKTPEESQMKEKTQAESSDEVLEDESKSEDEDSKISEFNEGKSPNNSSRLN